MYKRIHGMWGHTRGRARKKEGTRNGRSILTLLSKLAMRLPMWLRMRLAAVVRISGGHCPCACIMLQSG